MAHDDETQVVVKKVAASTLPGKKKRYSTLSKRASRFSHSKGSVMFIIACTCVGMFIILGMCVKHCAPKAAHVSEKAPISTPQKTVSQETMQVQKAKEETKASLQALSEQQQHLADDLKKAMEHGLVTHELTAEQSSTCAVLSKGRFVVSNVEGNQLLFEADPAKRRIGLYGNIGALGNVDIDGSVKANSLIALGSVVAERFGTDEFYVSNAGEVRATAVDAQTMHTQNLEAKETLDTQQLKANYANILSLSSEEVNVASTLQAALAKATRIQADSFEAQSLLCSHASIDSLQSSECITQNLSTENLSVEHATAKTVIVDQEVEAQNIHAGHAVFQELYADATKSDTLEARDVFSTTFNAREAHVDSLSTTLDALRVHSDSLGVVTFQPPHYGTVSRVQKIVLPVPANTVAVFISPSAQDSDAQAVIGVEQIGDTFTLVCRYPGYDEGCVAVSVIWLALQQ